MGGGGREREVVKGAQEEKLVGATAILTTMHARTHASFIGRIYLLLSLIYFIKQR